MKIKLSPQRRGDTLTVSKQGDTLTINGQAYDFSPIPDGATLPADAIDCEWITSDVERIDGVLHVTILLPHGADASEAARFPEPIIDPADGPLELPDPGHTVVQEAQISNPSTELRVRMPHDATPEQINAMADLIRVTKESK